MELISAGNYELELISKPGEIKYDYLYEDNENNPHWSSEILIKVYFSSDIFKTALIRWSGGGATGIHTTSYIVEPDRVVLCCTDSIFCLSIPELFLDWRTQADMFTCFEIFKYQDSYIVHGELEISRLDKNGKILWQQSGADIFVSQASEEPGFVITDDHILAIDWNGLKYTWDFNGNPIE